MTDQLAVLDRILARCMESASGGCWEWQGALTTGGYGHLRVAGKSRAAHRLTYEVMRSEIPTGLQLDHLCRVRHCVNPWHLEPVTQAVNMGRGNAGAYLAARTHCPQGHEYAGDNLYVNPAGRRICRTCQRVAARKYNGYQGKPPCAERTHCPQGHPYSGENLRVTPQGRRWCRACRQALDARRRAAKRDYQKGR